MPRNEIKLRRQMMSTEQIQRYRNYPALMKQFKRANRLKLAKRIFIYSLIITVFILLLITMVAYIMARWENNQGLEKKQGAGIGLTMEYDLLFYFSNSCR